MRSNPAKVWFGCLNKCRTHQVVFHDLQVLLGVVAADLGLHQIYKSVSTEIYGINLKRVKCKLILLYFSYFWEPLKPSIASITVLQFISVITG
jgi:hypothetical protein